MHEICSSSWRWQGMPRYKGRRRDVDISQLPYSWLSINTHYLGTVDPPFHLRAYLYFGLSSQLSFESKPSTSRKSQKHSESALYDAFCRYFRPSLGSGFRGHRRCGAAPKSDRGHLQLYYRMGLLDSRVCFLLLFVSITYRPSKSLGS